MVTSRGFGETAPGCTCRLAAACICGDRKGLNLTICLTTGVLGLKCNSSVFFVLRPVPHSESYVHLAEYTQVGTWSFDGWCLDSMSVCHEIASSMRDAS